MNALTDAEVHAEDLLFATLDPTIRKVHPDRRPGGAAGRHGGFHSQAAAPAGRGVSRHPGRGGRRGRAAPRGGREPAGRGRSKIAAVEAVLDELGVLDKPMVTAFNKLDSAARPRAVYERARSTPLGVAVSALTGDGLDELRRLLTKALPVVYERRFFRIPYSAGAALSALKRHGRIINVGYEDDAVLVEAEVEPKLAGRLQEFVLDEAALDAAVLAEDAVSGETGGGAL